MKFDVLSLFAPWAKVDEQEYDQQLNNNLESITAPKFDDGATEIESERGDIAGAGLFQRMYGQNEPGMKNTRELIDTYRQLMNNYEVDNAVQEIVLDAIVYEDDHPVVSLDLDNTDFSPAIKDRLQAVSYTHLTLPTTERV